MRRRIWVAAVVLVTAVPAFPGRLMLEPLTIKGDKFFLGSEEFRIWGFNVVRGMNLDEVRLNQSLDRLAFLGCNFVRLHTISETHYGETGWSCGLLPIEADISREFINTDGFFRLINGLRERRIYFCVDVLIGRYYTPKDGEIIAGDAGDLKAWQAAIAKFDPWGGFDKRAMTYLPIFDERARALTKEFVAKLFILRNPKTGLRLVEDPQFALISTCNEGYGFRLIREKKLHLNMPDYFRNKLVGQWNAFLLEKYGTDDKLRAAWAEKGFKGLTDAESLAKKNVGLNPLRGDAGYSGKRDADVLNFLTAIDMKFQREMSEFYRKEGFKGYSIYGDFNGAEAGTGVAWLASGLAPFAEDHDYPNKDEDIFRWRSFSFLRPRVQIGPHPYAQGVPYWFSEGASTNFSHTAYPLYQAVYFSLMGWDGATYFVWNMHFKRHWYGKPKLLTGEVRYLDMIGDYPLQMMIRAAGRLYTSRQIKPITDVETLKRLPKNANVQTDQVFRANGKGLLTVETDRFCAMASDHPDKIAFKKAEFNLTSDKCNAVVLEVLSGKEVEITAVGQAGKTAGEQAINDFQPLTWVKGTITLKGKTIESVHHLDDAGELIREVPGKGSAVELVEGVRLYRVKVK